MNNPLVPSLSEDERKLSIIMHPHPTLRHKSKPIRRVDSQLKDFAAQMFELMYQAKGVGLAANQVNLPLQMFVINTAGKPDQGEEMVFINPVISRPKGSEAAEEGCLSLPGIYGTLVRPQQIDFSAYTLQGEPVTMRVDGFLSRVLQHEVDHLQGVMFFQRMNDPAVTEIADLIDDFEEDFISRRDKGLMETDEAIEQRIAKFEAIYC